MSYAIEPFRAADLAELSQFLIAGFHAADDAEFAAEDVLRWKYLDEQPGFSSPRSFVAKSGGRIVGHVGISQVDVTFAGPDDQPRRVSALHMMDWLGSPEHRGVGASLMRHVHPRAEVQYVLGSSDSSRRVIAKAGYEVVATIPVFVRVLDPIARARLSHEGGGTLRRSLRVARDVADRMLKKSVPSGKTVVLERVVTAGTEYEKLAKFNDPHVIMSVRADSRLQSLLSYPRGGLDLWRLVHDGTCIGFALTRLAPTDPARQAKIVDCLLDTADPGLRHAAFEALTAELAGRKPITVKTCGATSKAATALTAAGFRRTHDLEFWLRDRARLIPRDMTYDFGFIEADYAYTS
jgi:predicted N-acetyltransferase YhbS